ncbi:MAG: hypothetical protein KGL31_14255 [candidate division NC10 bacterium]|nr:hypothetical protein [candidate division NC10 bacterium]MDE2323041.1 hypothetical protein [candidate division NC10 bacterium]
MLDQRWNLWKLTAIGMAVVFVTALITGLVVANWVGNQKTTPVAETPRGRVSRAVSPQMAPSLVARPSASDVAACNQYARSMAGDKTTETLKDALVGGAIGAGVGAAGGAIAGGGGGAGKGAGIGGLVGATAGTFYGLNEGRQSDARYVAAYRGCMRSRGYRG